MIIINRISFNSVLRFQVFTHSPLLWVIYRFTLKNTPGVEASFTNITGIVGSVDYFFSSASQILPLYLNYQSPKLSNHSLKLR